MKNNLHPSPNAPLTCRFKYELVLHVISSPTSFPKTSLGSSAETGTLGAPPNSSPYAPAPCTAPTMNKQLAVIFRLKHLGLGSPRRKRATKKQSTQPAVYVPVGSHKGFAKKRCLATRTKPRGSIHEPDLFAHEKKIAQKCVRESQPLLCIPCNKACGKVNETREQHVGEKMETTPPSDRGKI